MSDLELDEAYSSFRKREPVVLAHLVTAPIAGVASYLVTHGVVTQTQASQATQWAVTAIATAVIALQGFVLRRFVAPAWKAHAGQAAEWVGDHADLGDVAFDDENGDRPDAYPAPTAVELTAPAAELAAATSKPDLPSATV